jgi:DNA primase
MMFDPDLKERVRESADIVEIIGEHVKLKRVGTSFRGPCPFHQGKDPNFSVSPTHHSYHCFVCQESGDVFSFLQKHLGFDFPMALRTVARRVGIEVPTADAHRSGPDPREPVREALAAAAEFYRWTLWEDAAGAAARDYLDSRGVDRALADRFGIGYASGAPATRAHLSALGITDDRLVAAGLLVAPEDGGEPRLRFRRRLIFPIFDGASHPVGFGGRLIGPGEPKYLNSPESAVFTKRSLLYGYNWAKLAIRRDGRVLLVEGYFDLLRLVAAGIDAVVAPMGTALTTEQAALLARHTKQVVLMYDSDGPGLKATFRAGDELLRHGLRVRVVTLPDGDDPDTFVRAHGRAALDAALDGALDLFDRKVQVLERTGWFGDLDRKRTAIDKALPTIRAARDPILRELYVARLSEVSGVPVATLLREVASAEPGASSAGASPAPVAPERARTGVRDRTAERAERAVASGRRGERRRSATDVGAGAERALVRTVLTARGTLERVAEQVDPATIRDARYRAIYEALLAAGADATMDAVAAPLAPDAIAALQGMLAEGTMDAEPAQAIADSVARLRVRALVERLAAIDRTMIVATDAEKDELLGEKTRIMAEVRALQGRGFATYGKSRRGVDH